MPDAIVVQGLAKQFRRYHAARPHTLKEVLTHGFHRLKPVERFWALRDVSFRVASGQMLGVIGSQRRWQINPYCGSSVASDARTRGGIQVQWPHRRAARLWASASILSSVGARTSALVAWLPV